MEKEKLERITFFSPAYDKRSSDPKKDYGIGPVKCFMLVKGSKGVTHFIFSTGMLLDSTMEEYIATGRATYEKHEWGHYYLNKPMAYDVGYHSLEPLYDYHKENGPRPNCEWLDGRPCYGDGSALRADEWFKILLAEGSDKIWEMLEEEYYETFNQEK